MKKKIFAVITIILILICAYWYGGSSESSHGWTIRDENKSASEQNVSEAGLDTGDVVSTDSVSEITDIDDTEAGYEVESESDSDSDSESDLDSSGNLQENDVVVAASASVAPVSEDNNNKEEGSNNRSDNRDEKSKPNKKDKSTITIKDKKKDKNSPEKEVKNTKNNKSDSNKVTNNENEAYQDNNTVNSEPGSVNAGISESTVINTEVQAKIPTKAPVKAPVKAPTQAPLSTPTPSGKTCVISINCSDILKNMDMLVKGKEKIVPSDGLILEKTTVAIKKGDTVFDILKRVADEKLIHLEYSYTPIYGSYYVEGIANIYEFDCGDMSGWLYSVNDETISEGMSACEVSEGDVIKIWYTCDHTS